MTTNERIAEWAGWEEIESYGEGVRSIGRVPRSHKDWNDDFQYSFIPSFDTDITLWHGENGLLAEIENRHLSEQFVYESDGPWLGGDDDGFAVEIWAALRASPAQLAAALVKVIEEAQ